MKLLRRTLISAFVALAAMLGFTQDGTMMLLPFVTATGSSYSWNTNDFVISLGYSSSFTANIPGQNGFTYNAAIFWDTNAAPAAVTTWDDSDLSKAYASKTTNAVVVTGTFPRVYFNNSSPRTYVTAVENMGNVGWISLENGFYGCPNLLRFSVTPWNGSAVTSLVGAFRYCAKATNFPPVDSCVLVGSLLSTWQDGQAIRGYLPEVNTLTTITNLGNTWFGCYIYTNAFPAVSNLVSVNSLSNTWNTTAGTAYPYVNSLTNVIDLLSTWGGCNNCFTEFPAVSNLVNVKTLNSTWYNNFSITGAFPEVNTLTEVTNISATWANAEKMRSFPAVSNLLKVKSAVSAWADCDIATNVPYVNSLTGLTTIAYAWYKEYSNAVLPEVFNLTNVVDMSYTWYDCRNMVTVPVVTNLRQNYNFAGTYYNCYRATNEVPYMWDTNVFPRGPGANSDTFYNCTNMLGYRDVPKSYGGMTYTNNTNEFVTLWKYLVGTNFIPGKSGLTYDGKIRWSSNSGAWKFNTYNHVNLSKYYTWPETSAYHWVTITGKFPAVYFNNAGNKTNLWSVASFGDLGWSTMEGAFYGCNLVTNIPALPMSLTNATTFANAWSGCTNLTKVPTVSNFYGMVDISGAWQNCSALTSSVNDIFGAVTLTNLTNSANAFNGCSALTGSGMVFVTAAKHASYTEGNNATNSSYRTFYGCTNLLDWALIPTNYGGTAP